MSSRRAVVVGAGIGGLTAALALHRSGWAVQVLERAERLEPVGAGISLWPNALHAFETIGVAEQLRSRVALAGPSGVRRPDGRWLARTDVGAAVQSRFGAPLVVVHRAELVGLLVDALPQDALHLGVTVQGAEIDGLEADVVVAADGIRSTVRDSVLPSGPRPRYAGYTAWRMVVPAQTPTLEAFETWGGDGDRFAAVPMGADHWYCYATAKVPAGQYADAPGAELARRFRGWHEPIPQVVTSVPSADVLYQDVEELDRPMPAMHAGRVAFVGDSAHAMTPDLGQGGCMAVEDAVVLGWLLRDAREQPAVQEALAAYTAQRLRRTTQMAQRSRRAGRLYQAPYRLQVLVARVMGLLPDAVVVRGMSSTLGWRPPGVTSGQ